MFEYLKKEKIKLPLIRRKRVRFRKCRKIKHRDRINDFANSLRETKMSKVTNVAEGQGLCNPSTVTIS